MTPVVRCTFCGQEFAVAKDLLGGYANCPGCHKATQVEGLRDPIWRLYQAGVFVAVVAASWIVLENVGPWASAGVLLGGAGLAWLTSRAF